MSLSFESLVQALQSRLVGREPVLVAEDYPEAAVLVPIVAGDEPSLLLTKRAAHLRIHPGEIAFPGGKCDAEDPTLLATALREAEEEIGLEPHRVDSLGVLDQRVTRSNLRVTPCVGLVADTGLISPNPEEIAEVFTVPFSFFLAPSSLQWDYVEYRGEPRYVAYFQYESYRIWGMTAGVIVNLCNVVFDANMHPPKIEDRL